MIKIIANFKREGLINFAVILFALVTIMAMLIVKSIISFSPLVDIIFYVMLFMLVIVSVAIILSFNNLVSLMIFTVCIPVFFLFFMFRLVNRILNTYNKNKYFKFFSLICNVLLYIIVVFDFSYSYFIFLSLKGYIAISVFKDFAQYHSNYTISNISNIIKIIVRNSMKYMYNFPSDDKLAINLCIPFFVGKVLDLFMLGVIFSKITSNIVKAKNSKRKNELILKSKFTQSFIKEEYNQILYSNQMILSEIKLMRSEIKKYICTKTKCKRRK